MPPLFEPPAAGIVADVRRKLPLYISDFADGFSVKGLASITFLFFACLAPAIGFGGLMGVATAGQIGAVEMITATSLCGISYALLSGQPLTIVGSTGPVLAFTTALYALSARLGLAFLPFYGWVGLWSAGALACASLFSVSNVVHRFTRFTDETFSALISLIFISEALGNLGALVASPSVPCATACLSVLVAAAVYVPATALKSLRGSRLFRRPVRAVLADFAPTIGMLAAVGAGAAATARWGVHLPALAVPATFGTTTGRRWLVQLGLTPVWARWAAAVPAAMASVLLFMDQVRGHLDHPSPRPPAASEHSLSHPLSRRTRVLLPRRRRGAPTRAWRR